MSFSDQIKTFKQKCEDGFRHTHGNFTTILQERIMEDTPVLTGRLKSEWQATVGESVPTTSLFDENINSYSWQETIDKGKAEMEYVGIDDTTRLTNNCNYAYDIEFNRASKFKAPNGMVRINITIPILEMVLQQAVQLSNI